MPLNWGVSKSLTTSTFENITDRKRDNEALSKSEQLYRTLFELASDSIVLLDAETGTIEEFNQLAHETLGYNREEFQQLTRTDIEVEDSASHIAKHIEYTIKMGSDTFETKQKSRDGGVREVLIKAKAICIGEKQYLLSTWHDIKPHEQ